eukprot:6481001-Amphidinium_carterae.1
MSGDEKEEMEVLEQECTEDRHSDATTAKFVSTLAGCTTACGCEPNLSVMAAFAQCSLFLELLAAA